MPHWTNFPFIASTCWEWAATRCSAEHFCDEVIRRFKEDPKCRVLLLGLKAGGVGINLQAAKVPGCCCKGRLISSSLLCFLSRIVRFHLINRKHQLILRYFTNSCVWSWHFCGAGVCYRTTEAPLRYQHVASVNWERTENYSGQHRWLHGAFTFSFFLDSGADSFKVFELVFLGLKLTAP